MPRTSTKTHKTQALAAEDTSSDIASVHPDPAQSDTNDDSPSEIPSPVLLDPAQVEQAVAEIILQPKGRSAVPTFVTFREKGNVPKGHVIIDVPEIYLRSAWEVYKTNTIGAESEDYLVLVNKILKKGVPRLYRVVAHLDLSE